MKNLSEDLHLLGLVESFGDSILDHSLKFREYCVMHGIEQNEMEAYLGNMAGILVSVKLHYLSDALKKKFIEENFQ